MSNNSPLIVGDGYFISECSRITRMAKNTKKAFKILRKLIKQYGASSIHKLPISDRIEFLTSFNKAVNK